MENRKMAPQELLDDIVTLSRAKDHRMNAAQVSGKPMTLVSAESVLAYLRGREWREGVSPAERESLGARIEGRHFPVPGIPAAPQPAPAFDSRRIGREGIFVVEKDGEMKVYKVLRSQYSGHWQAKLFIPPEAKGGRGTWEYARGMMSVLREGHRMTPAQSLRYEALYGYPVCTRCGAPLENDESRERRYGPVCWGKKDDMD
jgi:hypothetical protein